jgi:hypothetical protein
MINSFLKVLIAIGLVALLTLGFLGFLIFFDASFRNDWEWLKNNNFPYLLASLFLGLLFTIITIIGFNKNGRLLNNLARLLLLLFTSYILSIVFAKIGTTNYWYFKYTLGIPIWALTIILFRKSKITEKLSLSLFISFVSIWFCEIAFYLNYVDTPPKPSLQYFHSFGSNLTWFLFLIFSLSLAPSLMFLKSK